MTYSFHSWKPVSLSQGCQFFIQPKYFHGKHHCLWFIQHVSISSLYFWECCLRRYKLYHYINKFGFILHSVKRRKKICVPGPVTKTLLNLEDRLNWTSYTLSTSSWAAMALSIAGIPTVASRGSAHSMPMEGPFLCRLSDGQRRHPLGFSDPGCLRAGNAPLLLRTQCLWVWAKNQSWVSSRLRAQAWGRLWRLPSHLMSPQWWGWVLGRGAGQLPGNTGWSVSSTVPCIFRAVPWFVPHFPCRYVNKMYFTQGSVDSGGPAMPHQRGWVFLFQVQDCLRREILSQVQKNRSRIQFGSKDTKCWLSGPSRRISWDPLSESCWNQSQR